MQKPGAVHHARWMAKAIYTMKIDLTKDQIPGIIFSDAEKKKLVMLANYCYFDYAMYFLQTAIPTAAPRLDLKLWKESKHYSVRN